MRPTTGLSNSKLNYTSSKLRNISALSNYEPPSHLNRANKQGYTKAVTSRKPPISKAQPELASTTNIQAKSPLLKKNTTRNLSQSQFQNLNLGTKLFETMDTKDTRMQPSPLPKSASRPHLNFTSNYKQPRMPIRAHGKVLADLDENTSINRIPVSPISVKRAVNPQMGASLDGENMWTEGPTLDFSALHGLQSPNLAGTYSIKRNSIDVNENRPVKPGHMSTSSFQMSLPELDSLKAFSKTVDATQYNNILNKKLQTPGTFLGDGEANLEKSETISCLSGQQLFSTMACHSMADVNQRKTLRIQPSTMLDSEIKDSIMKSPRFSHQTSIDASLKVRQPNADNAERTSIKGSATTSQSSPKSKLVNGHGEHSRKSSKLDNVKTYLSKFDISNSTTIIKQMFQPKKRLRCSCDSGLDEDQTCSRALGWLKKKYHPNEFEYLKATYEKIVSDSKPDNADQLKQIQKDVYRTYPNNKFFAADSPGLKSLQTVLNAFANYDPQIGYVQGMNFIGASLLYHAEEYITFWLLVMIFEIFEMRDIYLPKLPGLSKHCQIIDMLIFNYEHHLYLHLCQHEIKVEIFCTEWILALFASVIPVENMANFYEILLQQGWPFFYKIILAFLRQFEKQILEQDELLGILTVLKSQNHLIKNFAKDKNKMNLDWNALFQKAQKIEIDSHFIYKMHSNFDMDNQWFRTSFLKSN